MAPIIRKSKKTDLNEFVSMKKLYLEEATKIAKEKIFMPTTSIKKEFLETLKKRNSNILILEVNEQICGFMKISLYKKGKVSYLDDIFVKPEFQGKKYGKLLFKYFLNYSKEEDVEKMGLGTRVENERAISMYKKSGFKIIGYNFGKKIK